MCFGPLFHLRLSGTLCVASGPIVPHYLCPYFPKGLTKASDKVNGLLPGNLPQSEDGERVSIDDPSLRHRRSAWPRPKPQTPWVPRPSNLAPWPPALMRTSPRPRTQSHSWKSPRTPW